jgi:hypothetical protein
LQIFLEKPLQFEKINIVAYFQQVEDFSEDGSRLHLGLTYEMIFSKLNSQEENRSSVPNSNLHMLIMMGGAKCQHKAFAGKFIFH